MSEDLALSRRNFLKGAGSLGLGASPLGQNVLNALDRGGKSLPVANKWTERKLTEAEAAFPTTERTYTLPSKDTVRVEIVTLKTIDEVRTYLASQNRNAGITSGMTEDQIRAKKIERLKDDPRRKGLTIVSDKVRSMVEHPPDGSPDLGTKDIIDWLMAHDFLHNTMAKVAGNGDTDFYTTQIVLVPDEVAKNWFVRRMPSEGETGLPLEWRIHALGNSDQEDLVEQPIDIDSMVVLSSAMGTYPYGSYIQPILIEELGKEIGVDLGHAHEHRGHHVGTDGESPLGDIYGGGVISEPGAATPIVAVIMEGDIMGSISSVNDLNLIKKGKQGYLGWSSLVAWARRKFEIYKNKYRGIQPDKFPLVRNPDPNVAPQGAELTFAGGGYSIDLVGPGGESLSDSRNIKPQGRLLVDMNTGGAVPFDLFRQDDPQAVTIDIQSAPSISEPGINAVHTYGAVIEFKFSGLKFLIPRYLLNAKALSSEGLKAGTNKLKFGIKFYKDPRSINPDTIPVWNIHLVKGLVNSKDNPDMVASCMIGEGPDTYTMVWSTSQIPPDSIPGKFVTYLPMMAKSGPPVSELDQRIPPSYVPKEVSPPKERIDLKPKRTASQVIADMKAAAAKKLEMRERYYGRREVEENPVQEGLRRVSFLK